MLSFVESRCPASSLSLQGLITVPGHSEGLLAVPVGHMAVFLCSAASSSPNTCPCSVVEDEPQSFSGQGKFGIGLAFPPEPYLVCTLPPGGCRFLMRACRIPTRRCASFLEGLKADLWVSAGPICQFQCGYNE